ncbi:MAG: phospho-sugar mutase [Planctomycetota bacterium]|jgi:phosphoglucomutase/phosphomannomutase
MPSQVTAATASIATALQQGLITEGAFQNIQQWLTQPRYAEYQSELLEHIQRGDWKKLDDAFWTVIPFGTGGRRGRMYPIGSNAINDRTIGESAQGLADYILSLPDRPTNLSCALAYDTRHQSRHFAELCASIMVANGFHIYFLDDYRATPQLSFAVRRYGCTCGIMVTASHNPPSDNAVKVYWSTGGQVLPPHDANIIDRVMSTDKIKTTDFNASLAAGKITIVTSEVDAEYQKAALDFAWPGSRKAKIIYSPLHGVGGYAVPSLLKAAGFQDVVVYGPHSKPDGDFPNVPGHVSNPENPAVFDAIAIEAQKIGADLILATDPDCDRMGCSSPLTLDPGSPWHTINGNQIGALLTDFVLGKLKSLGQLPADGYVIKTLVTTELIRSICQSYGVRCEGNIHVGFKWIGGLMDSCGPDKFLFGTEESHGYLIGQYSRDKDGAVACLLMAELVAELKSRGLTLHQRLNELLLQHGVFLEDLINVQMEGSEGMANMKKLMQSFRETPPQTIGGLSVLAVRDYGKLTRRFADGRVEPLDAPSSNMLMLDLGDGAGKPTGNAIAVRPSGTEPKIKFYLFCHEPIHAEGGLDGTMKIAYDRIVKMKVDLKKLA